MSKILSTLLIYCLTITSVIAGLPPTTLKGESAAIKQTTFNTVVPNNQATVVGPSTGRIETGNSNLLVNPSFEATTFNSGWTCSLGSTTLETTAKTDGNQANAINSIGAGVRCYQTSTTNAANLKGLLGSAIVKIKTTDSIYKVCGLVDGNAAANERNCITVRPTSADLPFYPARTDFYMGGTSNGIVVYTTTTTSQPTVIDDAFVGVFNGGISTFSNNTSWVPCTFSSSTWTGYGTVTHNLQCRRDGPNLRMRGEYTGATNTTTIAQIPFPTNFGTIVSSSSYPANSIGGSAFRNVNGGANVFGNLIIQPNVSYFNISGSIVSQANNPSTPAGGSALASSGEQIKLSEFGASVAIAGWEANTNAAIAGCVDAFGCTNELSAKLTASTGVVTSENIDWINGNCTYGTPIGNRWNCPVLTGKFSAIPNCYIQTDTTSGASFRDSWMDVSNSSITNIVFATGTANATSFQSDSSLFIFCQKSGADFKPKTVVVSPFIAKGMLYTGAPPTGTLAASFNIITFGTKVRDTDNAYVSGTYTVPFTGAYSLDASVAVTGTYNGAQQLNCAFYVDGVTKISGVDAPTPSIGRAWTTLGVQGYPLNSGQLVTLRCYNDGTGLSFNADASMNYISISRTGDI